MKFILALLTLFTANQAIAANDDQGNVTIIRQSGSAGNSVTINQSGNNNVADVFQDGENNEADITQEGGTNQLKAVQIGDENKLKRHQKGNSFTTINQNGRITSYDEHGEVAQEH